MQSAIGAGTNNEVYRSANFVVNGATAQDMYHVHEGAAGNSPKSFRDITCFTVVTGAGAAVDAFLQRRGGGDGGAACGIWMADQSIIVLQFDEAAAPSGGDFRPHWFYHHQTGIYA
jgi:hypothetical protein